MIISAETYQHILAVVQRLLESGQHVSYELCDELDVSRDAVFSIYQQAYVRRQKKLTSAVYAKLGSIVKDVQNGKQVFDIAREMGFSPYQLAKMVAKRLYGESFQVLDIATPGGGGSGSQGPDPVLRADLMKCCMEDRMSSQKSDLLKRVVGQEFEEVLYDQLRSKHMCFETEEELRKKGKPKTPDVLFLIPMGLLEAGSEGHVVNWIDSKAMFGDEDTYADHLDQIKGYCNRYGPGLIIYWNGHVSTLKSNDMVAISDRFPDNWMFPTGEAADGSCPEFVKATTGRSYSDDASGGMLYSDRYCSDIPPGSPVAATERSTSTSTTL